eukprot:CAMPEP_0114235246 /NCGR_PEP_ID=MMETSP0058-20121206/6143_1 /TAXON_ID=36894 /ORGANISM="Pyramimonas parkeae, CCMP726" /LENGTH=280 /DNA_ID=CAMNT_0001346985 /DNA_START=338 /DNA_END=1177 /DNA_ORIENTATION=-
MEAMFAALSRQGIAVPDALGAMGAAGIVPSAAQLEEAFYAGMHGSPRLQLLPGQKRPRTDLMNLMSLPPNTAPVENSVPMTCQNEAFRPAPAFAQPQAYGTNMFADTQTYHANCDADRLKNLRLSNIRTSVSNEMDGDSGYSPNCLYFSPTLRASPFATNKPTNLGQLAFQQDRGEGSAFKFGNGSLNAGEVLGPQEDDSLADDPYKDVADPVERRRLQNREASARFRARGKARENEVRTLQWQVQVMVQRVAELEEQNRAMTQRIQQDAAVAQENALTW